MWALENQHIEIGRLLMKYHPQVHIQDKVCSQTKYRYVYVTVSVQKEWSPLVLASRAGDLEIVQGIVALGAEIDQPTNVSETIPSLCVMVVN